MRFLKFKVNGQKLIKDPECDFSGLVAGTKGYLKAHFTFSDEWKDCVIIARFWRGLKEHAVFLTNGECEIPPEVLVGKTFKVSLLGRGSKKYELTTNRIVVRQEVDQ